MTAVEVRHPHQRYGQHTAVDDVSFTVDEGEIFGIIGPTVGFGGLFPSALLLGLGAVPALREPSPDTGGLRPIDVWAPTALVLGMVMIAVQHVPASASRSRRE